MENVKVLINTPDLSQVGGVSSHYNGLKSYWTLNVKYNQIGARGGKSGSGKYWILWDLIKYLFYIIVWRPNVILLNPSVTINALKRDAIFLKVSHLFQVKTVIFIHGFHPEIIETLDYNWLCSIFNKSIGIIVLASEYKKYLEYIGVTSPIYLSTTKVDPALVGKKNDKENNNITILFLSRIVKEKGVFEALEAFKKLKCKYSNVQFKIVGDGAALSAVKDLAKAINDVYFTGALSGEDLATAYATADIYLFTSYSEGMPTTVLEAMANGLPVVTTKVGGLVDFFEDGKMGYAFDALLIDDIVDALSRLVDNKEERIKISDYNRAYAANRFMAPMVAKQLEHILQDKMM